MILEILIKHQPDHEEGADLDNDDDVRQLLDPAPSLLLPCCLLGTMIFSLWMARTLEEMNCYVREVS